MSDLTDFLLARIAEDDANLPEGFDCWYRPERYEAECEAKRRIVARHAECGTGYGYCDDGGHGWDDEDGPGCADLADAALPYADHADYRQEWKS